MELCAPLLELSGREAVEYGECLVDGVAEAHGRHVAYDGHDACGQLAIQLVVGRERFNPDMGQLLAQLIVGCACLDAELLGLLAARHDAAVVVGEHDDGLAFQIGPEDTLATDVAVVAIADGIPLHVFLYLYVVIVSVSIA